MTLPTKSPDPSSKPNTQTGKIRQESFVQVPQSCEEHTYLFVWSGHTLHKGRGLRGQGLRKFKVKFVYEEALL